MKIFGSLDELLDFAKDKEIIEQYSLLFKHMYHFSVTEKNWEMLESFAKRAIELRTPFMLLACQMPFKKDMMDLEYQKCGNREEHKKTMDAVDALMNELSPPKCNQHIGKLNWKTKLNEY